MSALRNSLLDWKKILKNSTPEVSKKILTARARHEDLIRLISEAKEAKPMLDFNYYRSQLSSKEDLDLVSSMERDASIIETKVDFSPKSLETASSEELNAIKRDEELAKERAISTLDSIQHEIAALKTKLEAIRSSKKFDEITVDDVYRVNPELKEAFLMKLKNEDYSSNFSSTGNEEEIRKAAH